MGGWGVRVRVVEDSTTHLNWKWGNEGVALCCHRDRKTVALDTVTRQERLPLNEVRERGVVCCGGETNVKSQWE